MTGILEAPKDLVLAGWELEIDPVPMIQRDRLFHVQAGESDMFLLSGYGEIQIAGGNHD